ncbi:MAG: type II restriction/modification system DNA methylase subunit YeeA [Bacteriovoracaceae bacterium]|jgi:type II restriction/modification system DNA methylase subunit YeeA
METTKLKKFAQFARTSLIEQVSSKLKQVLTKDSIARRESAGAINKLDEAIKKQGKEQVIERVSYIWFNRFCALRFMDVNQYTRIGVLSPSHGHFQPEILAEAKGGHIDKEMVPDKTRQQIIDLLDGKIPSNDSQGEAYRLLVVAVCNYWHRAMPFLFQPIDDYTELLMPDDLLSGSSILAYTREAMTPEVCKDVEVIGWLYQYYISEKKDEVFADLKKNKKVTPENIPAATQLFTPNWIVRYLVENSLGRLWMLNYPNSSLASKMEYYIASEQEETDFLKISSPEEIKICDPACGSGHMLTYAFDLLYSIYEEEGYSPSEISEKILKNNLFGVEIDERAGELAAFALTMKALSKEKRFLRKKVFPNVCVLENISFDKNELAEYMSFIGEDLFTADFRETLSQFEECDNFGSLIVPKFQDIEEIKRRIEDKHPSGQLFLAVTHKKVLKVLNQIDYLRSKYHVVVANPPYMGGKGMNGRLGSWAKENYEDSKSDLFAMFIERNLRLALSGGSVGMITMQSWMFLSSFEKLRSKMLNQGTLTSMAHLGARGFDSIGGEVVSTTAFTLYNKRLDSYKGGYLRLLDGKNELEKKSSAKEAIKNPSCGWFFRASSADFKKIPGSPIAYWVSMAMVNVFDKHRQIYECSISEGQNITANNDRFLRLHWEVNSDKIEKAGKWSFYSKGGTYRKWFGNLEYVVDWSEGAQKEYRSHPSARIIPDYLRFREGVTWTLIASSKQSFRYLPEYATFDKGGSSIFFNDVKDLQKCLLFLNTKISSYFTKLFNATLNLQVDDVRKLPLSPDLINFDKLQFNSIIQIAKSDWDSYENSWDFTRHRLLFTNDRLNIKHVYNKLRKHWLEKTLGMQRLEIENNRIFLDTYGIQDEFSPDVALNEITLTCNPHYRYGGEKTEAELEALLLADTMKELISYSVGCMFGRYSLDKEGLILANQGETLKDYLKLTPKPKFMPDQDNVIPLLEDDWFEDDITERFKTFLKVTFGEKNFDENLKFIENAIGKDIRMFFVKDFYNYHIKMYKKRPIYWMFSSPKGSFNALVYMHRYSPDLVSIVLNDYLREFRTKLSAKKDHLEKIDISEDSSQKEKTKATKEIESIKKVIVELDEYEHDILYPLATKKIKIDLDDGVKVNYPKFGNALKKIAGLS